MELGGFGHSGGYYGRREVLGEGSGGVGGEECGGDGDQEEYVVEKRRHFFLAGFLVVVCSDGEWRFIGVERGFFDFIR